MKGVVKGAAIATGATGISRMARNAQRAQHPAIFIENIELHVWDKTLYEAFAPFGRIEFCQILREESGASSGQGFVLYASAEEAQAAVAAVEGTGAGHALGVTTSAGNFVLPGCTTPLKCRHHPITRMQLEMQTQGMKQFRYDPSLTFKE